MVRYDLECTCSGGFFFALVGKHLKFLCVRFSKEITREERLKSAEEQAEIENETYVEIVIDTM